MLSCMTLVSRSNVLKTYSLCYLKTLPSCLLNLIYNLTDTSPISLVNFGFSWDCLNIFSFFFISSGINSCNTYTYRYFSIHTNHYNDT